MALEGSAVALAAQGHLLALVWHAGVSASPEDQCLQYAVYDVSQQQQVRRYQVAIMSNAYSMLCTMSANSSR